MEKIKVINRSDHMVAYSIESLRVHRVWYNVNDYIFEIITGDLKDFETFINWKNEILGK